MTLDMRGNFSILPNFRGSFFWVELCRDPFESARCILFDEVI